MLTIDEVVAAYKRIGFTPKRGAYNTDKEPKKCCGLEAIYISRTQMENNVVKDLRLSGYIVDFEYFKKYGEGFAGGFLNGFDHKRAMLSRIEEVQAAAKNGIEIREALEKIYGSF